ncbi:hypothetical protein SSX86_031779 [Deinandra increscens subsp. villosa]|uniref:Uncharacterized protein n=1 Tax=Deinandra increscens subsp. villosa TaxID=3103831 RepID=A0AAP0C8X1_9ASTR
MLSTPLRSPSSLSSLTTHSFKLKPSYFSSHLQNHPLWSGLQTWRDSSLNHNRFWGPSGPEPQPSSPHPTDPDGETSQMGLVTSLAEMGSLVLSTADPLKKSKLSHLAYSRWRREKLPVGVSESPHRPARPPRPQLVSCLFFVFYCFLIMLSKLGF